MPYNNNQQSGPNVNTTLTTIYAKEASLTVKAWNKLLSLEFAKATDTVDENGLASYDNDSSHHIRTSLTYEKCIVLKKSYDKILRPAILEGTPKTISILIRGTNGEKKLLTLGYNGEAPFIRISWGLAETGTANNENSISMTLRPVEYYTDYNILTGESEAIEEVNVDLDKFMECVAAVGAQGFLVSHAIRFGNALYASYANGRNAGNNAAYGRGYNNQYGGNQYQSNNNYGQQRYNAQNAFMPSASDMNIGGDMNDVLPFN